MSNEVNVDTLFLACVEGRADDLRTLCAEGHAHFLNEMIENNDKTSRFTMVYSYLERVEGQPDFEIMEALYDCGADFDCQIITNMEDGTTKYTRLIQVAIQVWKNDKLTYWLIDHGTDLNVEFVVMEGEYILARQNLLRIELDPAVYSRDILTKMVLKGVDVKRYCDVPDGFGWVPPLFIAVAINRSVEQAAILMTRGATVEFTVEERNAPQRGFVRYCELCDRNGEEYIFILKRAQAMALRIVEAWAKDA